MTPHDRGRPTGAPASAAAVVRTRQRVLEALRGSPQPTTVAALATRLGIHPNTTRFHLERLIADGDAERLPSPPRGPGRPAVLVRATAAPRAARHYRLLAEALSLAVATTPGGIAAAEQAGRVLGRRLAAHDAATASDAAPLTVLLDVLRDLDFAPEHRAPDTIALAACPFLELAGGAGGGPACAVHLGLMRGALEALDTDLKITALTPYASPDHCLTRLGTAA